MGKHKLLMSSEQTFFTPFKKNTDSNLVDSAGYQKDGEKLRSQDQLDNNAKTRASCITSTPTTASRSSVFPANYTLHVGKLTTKAMPKSQILALSPSCLFPSRKRDKNIEIPASSHSLNSVQEKGEKLVRTKALCRREYTTSRQKQSSRLLNGSRASKNKPLSQCSGVKSSLLILIENTVKEISELRKRQRTLCNKQQSSSSVKDNANDRPRFQADPDQSTLANEVDDTEE